MVYSEVLEQHESRDRSVAMSLEIEVWLFPRKYNAAVIEVQEPVRKVLQNEGGEVGRDQAYS